MVQKLQDAIAALETADEYTVTLSLTTSMSIAGNNYKTTENGTAVFEVKAKNADNVDSILVAGDVEGATVTVEKTGSEIKNPVGDTWFTWTVTVSDVTADVTVPLSIEANDVTVETSEDSYLTATLLSDGLKVGDKPATTTQIQLAVSDAEMWKLPTTVEVKNGGNDLGSSDYNYNKDTGIITIKAGIEFKAVITIVALAQAAQDTYTVSVDGRGATVSPAAIKKGEPLGAVTITVGTGFSPVTSVADIREVTGTNPAASTATEVAALIDSVVNGVVTFKSSVVVTGNVTIALDDTTEAKTTVSGNGLTVTGVKIGGVEVTKTAGGAFEIPQKTALKDIEVTLTAGEDEVVNTITSVKADANSVAYEAAKSGNTVTITFTGAQTLTGIDTLTITGTATTTPEAISELAVSVSNIGVVEIEDARVGNSDTQKYALVSGVADIESIMAGWDGNTTESDAAQDISSTFSEATALNSGVVGTAAMSLTATDIGKIVGWNGEYRLVCVTVGSGKITAAGVSDPINLGYTVDGTTVTLIEDIILPAPTDGTESIYTMESGVLTIDLNGHTIKVDDGGADGGTSTMFKVVGSAQLTVKNGTLDGNKGVCSLFRVMDAQTPGRTGETYALTLENVDVLNDPTGTGWNDDEAAVYVVGQSNVKITDSTLSSSQNALGLFGGSAKGTIEVIGTRIIGGVLVSCNVGEDKGSVTLKNSTVTTDKRFGVRVSGGTLNLRDGSTIENTSNDSLASAIVFGKGGSNLISGTVTMDNNSEIIGVRREIGVLYLGGDYGFSDTSNIGTWKVTNDGEPAQPITTTLRIQILETGGKWVTGYNLADGISATETPEEPSVSE